MSTAETPMSTAETPKSPAETPAIDLGAAAHAEELTRALQAQEAEIARLQDLLRHRGQVCNLADASLAITALLGLHNAKHGTPAAKNYLAAAVKLGDELAASILAPR